MQHLDRPGVSFCTRTTHDDNAITNAIEIYTCPRYIVFLLLVVLSFDLIYGAMINVLVFWFLVVQFISQPQIMILESETLIWRNFSFLIIFVFPGQWTWVLMISSSHPWLINGYFSCSFGNCVTIWFHQTTLSCIKEQFLQQDMLPTRWQLAIPIVYSHFSLTTILNV